jgi:hypothetical protein
LSIAGVLFILAKVSGKKAGPSSPPLPGSDTKGVKTGHEMIWETAGQDRTPRFARDRDYGIESENHEKEEMKDGDAR